VPSFYSFQTSGRIVSGMDCTRSLDQHLSVFSNLKSVLILTQPFLTHSEHMRTITGQLENMGVSVQVIDQLQQEPSVDHIQDVHEQCMKRDYDLYMGIGGGSVLDATKLLAVLRTNRQPLREMLGTDRIGCRGIPTVLVPTTAGTGSEVTPNAIVTLPEEKLKVGIVSRHLLPDLVLLDPRLTLGLPKPMTAATGMDAFAHSFESFISNKANPISDMFALESIRLISGHLLEAYRNGGNYTARENMLLGSMYGGMALTSSGTTAVHALAYPLGGMFHIPHGVANAMLLVEVTRFNMDAILHRMPAVAEAMKLGYGLSPEEAGEKVLDTLSRWTAELDIPPNLSKYGVSEQDLQPLAEAAMKVTRLLNNNPKKVTVDDAYAIYRKLL